MSVSRILELKVFLNHLGADSIEKVGERLGTQGDRIRVNHRDSRSTSLEGHSSLVASDSLKKAVKNAPTSKTKGRRKTWLPLVFVSCMGVVLAIGIWLWMANRGLNKENLASRQQAEITGIKSFENRNQSEFVHAHELMALMKSYYQSCMLREPSEILKYFSPHVERYYSLVSPSHAQILSDLESYRSKFEPIHIEIRDSTFVAKTDKGGNWVLRYRLGYRYRERVGGTTKSIELNVTAHVDRHGKIHQLTEESASTTQNVMKSNEIEESV